jgi:hypothetical protein
MSHLSSSPHRHRRARIFTAATLVIAALCSMAAGAAQARPVDDCEGSCQPPRQVTVVYRAAFAYSTPYLNARSRHAVRPASYVATCEAYSSAGRSGTRWWSRMHEGTWVNNADLHGGARMGLPSCVAPGNDAPPAVHAKLKPCGNSDWMTRAGGMGSGRSFVVSILPTKRARAVGRLYNPLGEPFITYIWRDVRRCVQFPSDLVSYQRASIYKQLACHIEYGVATPLGGNTWDLEAFRGDVSWDEALKPRNGCQW